LWAAGTRLVVSNILEATRLKNIYKVSRDGLRYTTEWYANDAAYFRGYAFRIDRDQDHEKDAKNVMEAKAAMVSDHPGAWEAIKTAIRKR
jgi:hypothetical protein